MIGPAICPSRLLRRQVSCCCGHHEARYPGKCLSSTADLPTVRGSNASGSRQIPRGEVRRIWYDSSALGVRNAGQTRIDHVLDSNQRDFRRPDFLETSLGIQRRHPSSHQRRYLRCRSAGSAAQTKASIGVFPAVSVPTWRSIASWPHLRSLHLIWMEATRSSLDQWGPGDRGFAPSRLSTDRRCLLLA